MRGNLLRARRIVGDRAPSSTSWTPGSIAGGVSHTSGPASGSGSWLASTTLAKGGASVGAVACWNGIAAPGRTTPSGKGRPETLQGCGSSGRADRFSCTTPRPPSASTRPTCESGRSGTSAKTGSRRACSCASWSSRRPKLSRVGSSVPASARVREPFSSAFGWPHSLQECSGSFLRSWPQRRRMEATYARSRSSRASTARSSAGSGDRRRTRAPPSGWSKFSRVAWRNRRGRAKRSRNSRLMRPLP